MSCSFTLFAVTLPFANKSIYTKENLFMKNMKRFLVLAFCCALLITSTTVVTEDYSIELFEHHLDDTEKTKHCTNPFLVQNYFHNIFEPLFSLFQYYKSPLNSKCSGTVFCIPHCAAHFDALNYQL